MVAENGRGCFRTSWLGLFLWRGGWSVVAMAVLTLLLTYGSVRNAAQARTVKIDGVPVLGLLVARDRVTEKGQTTYRMTYRLTIDGRQVDETHTVSRAEFEARDAMIREFMRPSSDPDRIAAREAMLTERATQLRHYALLSGLAALVLLWLTGRDATRMVMARRVGREEDAYIFVKQVRIPSKGLPRARIKFRSHTGIEGQSRWYFEWRLTHFDRGDSIRVFVWRDTAWWTDETGPRARARQDMPRVGQPRRRWRYRSSGSR